MSHLPKKPPNHQLPPPVQRWSRLCPVNSDGSASPTDSAQSRRWRKLLAEEQL